MSDRHAWPDWKLERLLLEELPPEELAQARRDLKQSKALRERLDKLRQSSAVIREQYPPDEMAAEIRRRLHKGDRSRRQGGWQPWTSGLAVAAAALVALGIGYVLWTQAADPATNGARGVTRETVRVKGLQPSLRLYRQTDDGAQQLDERAVALEGDVLQVGYVAAGRSHGVVVSIDGRGVVTLHHPSYVGGQTRLKTSGRHVLAHAYQLDDAPGFERFFLVSADRSIDVEQVVAAAETLAARQDKGRRGQLRLDNDYDQTSFLVEKE